MIVTTIVQPETQLGLILDDLLNNDAKYEKIKIISAFASLKTSLRFRERLNYYSNCGCDVMINFGIDLNGTSKNVLEEILTWKTKSFISHNANPRVTFHPKIYLFESQISAILIIGSNNFTDGGLYTNSEAATRIDFALPKEICEYEKISQGLEHFINPEISGICKELTRELIDQLFEYGIISSEDESKKIKRDARRRIERKTDSSNPFSAETVTYPPLLPIEIRNTKGILKRIASKTDYEDAKIDIASGHDQIKTQINKVIVWRKKLSASDVLQVHNVNSKPVGGMRLTQAEFLVAGQVIDQTKYFRQLFDDYDWEPWGRGQKNDQERTFVPMLVYINNKYKGVQRLQISHKPSGEADQGNYTTLLHWGTFSDEIKSIDLTSWILSLYELTEPINGADFCMEIINSDDQPSRLRRIRK